jgi:hypothetical protein
MSKGKGNFTCEGDALETSLSCCNVLSTVLCFWKFCRGFDGPHMPSAMVTDLSLVMLQWCRRDRLELEFRSIYRRGPRLFAIRVFVITSHFYPKSELFKRVKYIEYI